MNKDQFAYLNETIVALESERDNLRKLNGTLADWNDSLRITIDDYLNERANKQDLKMALTSWTKHDEMEAKDAGIAALKSSVHSCNQGVIDGLQAEIGRLRNALEGIMRGCDCEMDCGGERWCNHVNQAKSALSDKKGAV